MRLRIFSIAALALLLVAGSIAAGETKERTPEDIFVEEYLEKYMAAKVKDQEIKQGPRPEIPIEKGSFLIGGSMAFHAYTGELYDGPTDQNHTTAEIVPSLGYFVRDGLMLAVEFNYYSDKQNPADVSSFGGGPRIAYYFNLFPYRQEIAGSFYPYIAVFGTYRRQTANGSTDSDLYSAGGQAGALLMAGRNIAIDLGVRVSRDEASIEGSPSKDYGVQVRANVGFSAFIF